MRNHWLGGGLLAAGTLLAVGVAYIFSGGSGSVVQAQATECPDEGAHCLLIIKETDPEDTDQDFDFASDSEEGAFSLGSGESAALTIDEAGTITVVEEETDGWTLADISCDEPEGVDVDIDEGAREVSVEFGEIFAEVTCTFTNEMDDTPTPTATATQTATATGTVTTTVTTTVAPSASATQAPTNTAVPPTATTSAGTGGTISPPSTGSGGLKN